MFLHLEVRRRLKTQAVMLDCETFACGNSHASLKHHRNSLLGSVIDYVITFNTEVTTVEDVIDIACGLFESLCERFGDKSLKSDLCAKVRYLRRTTEEEVTYYHTSSPCGEVLIPMEFFKRHMLKIASRMDDMNEGGSNLLILAIEEIHVRLSIYE